MKSENQNFHLLLRCLPPSNPQLLVFYTRLNKLAQNEYSARKVITDVKAITWRRYLVVAQKYNHQIKTAMEACHLTIFRIMKLPSKFQ